MTNHPPEIEALYREHGELTERLFCCDDATDEDWRRLEAVRAALHAYQEQRNAETREVGHG